MGVTIHYRGSLAEVSRVEDFEDRVIDLAALCRWKAAVIVFADSDSASRMKRCSCPTLN